MFNNLLEDNRLRSGDVNYSAMFTGWTERAAAFDSQAGDRDICHTTEAMLKSYGQKVVKEQSHQVARSRLSPMQQATISGLECRISQRDTGCLDVHRASRKRPNPSMSQDDAGRRPSPPTLQARGNQPSPAPVVPEGADDGAATGAEEEAGQEAAQEEAAPLPPGRAPATRRAGGVGPQAREQHAAPLALPGSRQPAGQMPWPWPGGMAHPPTTIGTEGSFGSFDCIGGMQPPPMMMVPSGQHPLLGHPAFPVAQGRHFMAATGRGPSIPDPGSLPALPPIAPAGGPRTRGGAGAPQRCRKCEEATGAVVWQKGSGHVSPCRFIKNNDKQQQAA